jgi:sugar/nucleoside kinase (ribokinase family)
MFDLITIGDTTLDVFLELEEVTLSYDINKEACLICFNYADKIPVKEVTKIAGVGNAANVAVGARRLGLKTAIYTVLGNDDLAKDIAVNFEKEKIASDYIEFDKERETNYSTVLVHQGERTILVHKEPRDYKLPNIKGKTKWIYFSSLATDHGSMHSDIMKLVKQDGIKVGFNPGSQELRLGIKKLESLMGMCTVFIVNTKEAQSLVGEKIKDFHELLRLLHKEGPEIVVITDAEHGSYAYDGKDVYFQRSLKTKMKERTGAGDSYATGFVSALVTGHKIPEAMRWGTLNAVSVIQYIGAQQGLLKRRQMTEALNKHPKLKAQKITKKKII